MRACVCACALMAMLFVCQVARAHHPSNPVLRQHRSSAVPDQSQARLAMSVTQLNSEEGLVARVWTLAAAVELRVASWLAVHVLAPMHKLDGHVDDTGPGDVILGGRASLDCVASFCADASLDIHAPTGDASMGLGSGTFAIEPGALLRYHGSEHVAAHVQGSVIVDVFERTDQSIDPVSQRETSEARAVAGLGWTSERIEATTELRLAIPLADSSQGSAFASAAVMAATRLSDHFWLDLVTEVPIHPTRRIQWMAGVGIAYRWGRGGPMSASPETR